MTISRRSSSSPSSIRSSRSPTRARKPSPASEAGMMEARVIELEIRSDVNEIEGVVERVQRECEAMRFTRTQLMLNLPVALTEALSNAILRGNLDDPDKSVRVEARVDMSALVVDVMDEGAGF